MGSKKELGLDKDGFQLTMRRSDYMADMLGQLGLGLMANIVGQLQYFYTDKVGVAVGSVGVMLGIAKVIDAFTDVIVGNVVDHSKGGNKKYYSWMIKMTIPAAIIMLMMFTVPISFGQIPALAYVLITNVLLTAVIYTMIATPFSSVMVVRTRSQSERSNMGIFRAIGNYGSGMIIAIITIPVTNALGGTQAAWIKYGAILALIVLLCFLICYRNGKKAKFPEDFGESAVDANEGKEEEAVAFKEAMGMLFRNRYWVIVLMFNLITNITNTVASSAGTYYCKWIFGNDNLISIIGAVGLLATFVGFAASKPIINKLGVRGTVNFGLIGAALAATVRCFAPDNLGVYIGTSLVGSFVQIPLMCLYGVLLAMAVDYNEYKYDKKLVAMSSGAIGFGSKVGGGLGTVLLSAFLAFGAYDATLKVASDSMRTAIFGFSNVLPIIINVIMFLLFTKFDIEKKLPAMREEVEKRHS